MTSNGGTGGRRRRRIDIPEVFAAIPQALLRDRRVCSEAVRLWGVLYCMAWNDEPPDTDRLRLAMTTAGPTPAQGRPANTPPEELVHRRSVYRWLQQLVDTGWLRWEKNSRDLDQRFELLSSGAPIRRPEGVVEMLREALAGGERDQVLRELRAHVPDFVTLLSQLVTTESQNGRPGVTTESESLTIESQIVTPESRSVTTESHGDRLDRTTEGSVGAPSYHENVNMRSPTPGAGGGGGVDAEHDDRGPGWRYLRAQGFYPATCDRYGHYTESILRRDVEGWRANGSDNGAIVAAWQQAEPGRIPIPEARQRAAGADFGNGGFDRDYLARLNAEYGDLFVSGGEPER